MRRSRSVPRVRFARARERSGKEFLDRASFRHVRGAKVYFLISACRNRGSPFPRNLEAPCRATLGFLETGKGELIFFEDGTADGTRS
jgi:hypothetical protein